MIADDGIGRLVVSNSNARNVVLPHALSGAPKQSNAMMSNKLGAVGHQTPQRHREEVAPRWRA